MNCGIYEPARHYSHFCKNADFRLFDRLVRMGGQFLIPAKGWWNHTKEFFMKNLFKARTASLFGVIALVAIIGFSMAACDNDSGNDNNDNNNSSGGGLSGTWRGNIGGLTATVTITSTGWTMSAPGFSDSGTYTIDGITTRLRSTVYGLETGTAVLLDSNTISVTLNSNSIAPGTYTLYRQ
jgi:hypothetical protein